MMMMMMMITTAAHFRFKVLLKVERNMKLTSCCVCLNHGNNQSRTECHQSLSIMSEISDE